MNQGVYTVPFTKLFIYVLMKEYLSENVISSGQSLKLFKFHVENSSRMIDALVWISVPEPPANDLYTKSIWIF